MPFGALLKSQKFPHLKFVVNCGFDRVGAMYNLFGLRLPNAEMPSAPSRVKLVQPTDLALVALAAPNGDANAATPGLALTQGDIVARIDALAQARACVARAAPFVRRAPSRRGAQAIGFAIGDRVLLATAGGDVSALLTCAQDARRVTLSPIA